MTIQIRELAKSYGARVLFSDVSLQLNDGCRYGLVGANGSGKSTLLNILTGQEPSTGGSVNLSKGATLGVLEQDRFLDDAALVVEVAMMGDVPAYRALKDLEALVAAEAPPAELVTEAEERITAHDGYTLEARASEVLLGLGISQSSLREPLARLSGGFKLRVLLARVLVGHPDVLLLDEPTNHLDILSIAWLEQFLRGYLGCAVIISHDHRFLNAVASHVLDVDYQTVTPYVGNYDRFVVQKAQTRIQKEAEIARMEKLVDQKKAFVERFRYKATKARQAQSRLKQIDKIEIERLPPTSRRAPNFQFEARRRSGREALAVEGLTKSFGSHRVLTDVRFNVMRGERVGIIGANGLGKSTLLKILVGRLGADAGELRWGHEAHVGYFAQDHKELLDDPRRTLLDFIWDACPGELTSFVRGQLGRMLFSDDDVHQSVGALSGGEAARLLFCRLMVEKPNVLVLDEPTNHLDLEAIEALVQALLGFTGTLLCVSHDRWFVAQLATRIVELTPSGVRFFPGTYDEHVAQAGEDHLDRSEVVLRARHGKQRGGVGGARGAARGDDRARLRKRDALLEEIATLERQEQESQGKYAEPGFFDQTTPRRLAELDAEARRRRARIDELTRTWETVETEIERSASSSAGEAGLEG